MATEATTTLTHFINPTGVYTAAELVALQQAFDTAGLSIFSLLASRAPDIYPGMSSLGRTGASGNSPTLTAQRMQLTRFRASKSMLVTNMRAVVHGTAAATITTVQYGIYSIASNGDITLVGSTTNDATLLIATNTGYSKALTTPVFINGGQEYYAAILVDATTMPILSGSTYIAADVVTPPLFVAHVTGQASMPATVATASVVNSTGSIYMEMT